MTHPLNPMMPLEQWEAIYNAQVSMEHAGRSLVLFNVLRKLVSHYRTYPREGDCDGRERHSEASDCFYCEADRLVRLYFNDAMVLTHGPAWKAKGEA